MYDSPTIDMRVASQPSGISMLCLSCHDGSIAMDATNKGPLIDSNDLSGSHPISITYDASRDHDFAVVANGQVGGLPLYGDHEDQVECVTCHDPHDNSRRALLRMDNRGSALCLACHTK